MAIRCPVEHEREGAGISGSQDKDHVTHSLSEPEPAAGDAERHRDDKPDGDDDEHGGERNGAAGALGPEEKVEHEEGGEDDAGDEQRRQDDVGLPGFAAKGLVSPCRDVPAHEAKDGVQQHRDRADRAAVRGGEESHEGKD